jgi:hypothetical protein
MARAAPDHHLRSAWRGQHRHTSTIVTSSRIANTVMHLLATGDADDVRKLTEKLSSGEDA